MHQKTTKGTNKGHPFDYAWIAISTNVTNFLFSRHKVNIMLIQISILYIQYVNIISLENKYLIDL